MNLPPEIAKTKQNVDALVDMFDLVDVPENLLPCFYARVTEQHARLIIYPDFVTDNDVESLLTFCEGFVSGWTVEEETFYTWHKKMSDNFIVRVIAAHRKPKA